MKSILFLTSYPSLDASRRLRIDPLIDLFAARGYKVEVHQLFSAAMYRRKNSDKISRTVVSVFLLARMMLRLFTLLRQREVIYVHREAFPFFTPLLERFARTRCNQLVLDVDDAIYANPTHTSDWRARLRNPQNALKFRNIFDFIVCGSPYLGAAFDGGSAKIHFAPTCPPKPVHLIAPKSQRQPIILWTGSYSTLPSLLGILDALENVCRETNARLHVLGGTNVSLLANLDWVSAELWTEARELELLEKAAVGVMPLPDTLWERGKCGFKAILYISAGMRAVVSPVGMNEDLSQRYPQVYAASTGSEWIENVRLAINDGHVSSQDVGAARDEFEPAAVASSVFHCIHEDLTPPAENVRQLHVILPTGQPVIDASREEVVTHCLQLMTEARENEQPRVAYALHVGGLNARTNTDYMTALLAADLVYADGASVTHLARVAGATRIQRSPTTDLGHRVISALHGSLKCSVRIALIGGPPQLAERAGSALKGLHGSTIDVVFSTHGYHSDAEWGQVLDGLRAAEPDIVVIGLGCPQESLFVHKNLRDLPPSLILTCGGWFSFLAGEEGRAPQVMQSLGLEWFHRLFNDPTRLLRRYVTGALNMTCFLARAYLSRGKETVKLSGART